MATIQRRLLKEYTAAKENSDQISQLGPKGNDVLQLEAKIVGPENSPYADYIFTLDIHLPTDFPLKPPKVKFVTPIYHPAIKDDGSICLDVLGEKWTPNLSIVTILLQIIELMADPSTESPIMPAIAQQVGQNRDEFNKTARKYAEAHAQSKTTEQIDESF